jgi:hypothetical protein
MKINSKTNNNTLLSLSKDDTTLKRTVIFRQRVNLVKTPEEAHELGKRMARESAKGMRLKLRVSH